jgi:hypothetical protein
MIITDENIQQLKNLRGEYLVSYRRDGVVMLRNSADYKMAVDSGKIELKLCCGMKMRS